MRKKDLQRQLNEANRRLADAYPEKERYQHITRIMASHVLLSQMLYSYDAMLSLTIKEHPDSKTIRAAVDQYRLDVGKIVTEIQTVGEEYRHRFNRIQRDDAVVGDMLSKYNRYFKSLTDLQASLTRLLAANLGTSDFQRLEDYMPGLPPPAAAPEPIVPKHPPVGVDDKPSYPLMTNREAVRSSLTGPVITFVIVLLVLFIAIISGSRQTPSSSESGKSRIGIVTVAPSPVSTAIPTDAPIDKPQPTRLFVFPQHMEK